MPRLEQIADDGSRNNQNPSKDGLRRRSERQKTKKRAEMNERQGEDPERSGRATRLEKHNIQKYEQEKYGFGYKKRVKIEGKVAEWNQALEVFLKETPPGKRAIFLDFDGTV